MYESSVQWRIQEGVGGLTPLRIWFAYKYMKRTWTLSPLEEFLPRPPPP